MGSWWKPESLFPAKPMAGVFYLPSTQSRLVLQETVHTCYYPELDASWDGSRIACTEVQPANHCAIDLLRMHLSLLSPRDTLGIRLPKQCLPPGIWKMTLALVWDLMSQLGYLEEIRSKFEGHPGDFWQNCHMGRELDPNFSKLSNSLG